MISIDSGFDSGNIIVDRLEGPHDIALSIRRDAHSDFFQWFHFRVAGARGQPLTLRITGLEKSAYPGGWPGYRAVISHDRQHWQRTPTGYDPAAQGGTLSISVTPESDHLWVAYFAPYSLDRHHDLVARAAATPGVSARVLGHSLQGRPIDCLSIGTGPRQCWIIARQHPGEAMAQWFMEGAIDHLIAHPLAGATLHLVPNMNPDGSTLGHLRTNAAGHNLNREWASPSPDRSPEVLAVLTEMERTGVDFALDVHGDEAIPHCFIAGFEGIPAITPAQLALLHCYRQELAARTPDFQLRIGYPPAPPGRANLAMATNQIANRFGCLAMTLEMPFKDHDDAPDPRHGWSPARSAALAVPALQTLAALLPRLRPAPATH
jgi:murein tripeptide amidase MpaA